MQTLAAMGPRGAADALHAACELDPDGNEWVVVVGVVDGLAQRTALAAVVGCAVTLLAVTLDGHHDGALGCVARAAQGGPGRQARHLALYSSKDEP